MGFIGQGFIEAGDRMSMRAEYYTLKGVISELPKEDQEKIEAICKQVLELMQSSDEAKIGVALAVSQLEE
ncbi:hypothetical protein SAMN05216409_1307 [Pseudomonas lutea]|uniref:Uncharacterized protein n=2 Tax=Pseudomonas TaxID=286 RepID=A0A9X8MHU9_9PSED|nr:hypothetical protein SAMN05216409_1307 [Pseudomonas lutea]